MIWIGCVHSPRPGRKSAPNFVQKYLCLYNEFIAFLFFFLVHDLFKKSVSSTSEVIEEITPHSNLISVSEKVGGSIWHIISRSDYLIYFGLSITLGLSIIQVWQQYFPTIFAFGSSGLAYSAALLFGFASEGLLSEAFDFAKRS